MPRYTCRTYVWAGLTYKREADMEKGVKGTNPLADYNCPPK